jgi:hypothetical protein
VVLSSGAQRAGRNYPARERGVLCFSLIQF